MSSYFKSDMHFMKNNLIIYELIVMLKSDNQKAFHVYIEDLLSRFP